MGKGRRSYCSKECAVDFEIKYFPSRTRWHVHKRDKGVCAKCGCDTDRLRRIFRWAKQFSRDWQGQTGGVWGHWYSALRSVARELGFNGIHSDGDFWQADHVHEVARGGWGCSLDKLRTLCTPCHKEETKRLAGELAAERRAEKLAKKEGPTIFDAKEAA